MTKRKVSKMSKKIEMPGYHTVSIGNISDGRLRDFMLVLTDADGEVLVRVSAIVAAFSDAGLQEVKTKIILTGGLELWVKQTVQEISDLLMMLGGPNAAPSQGPTADDAGAQPEATGSVRSLLEDHPPRRNDGVADAASPGVSSGHPQEGEPGYAVYTDGEPRI